MDRSSAQAAAVALAQIDALGSGKHFAGNEMPPNIQHLGAFPRDEDALRRVILDAFRDRAEIQQDRIGLCRIAAASAVTVFCIGTKPAEAPPTGEG